MCMQERERETIEGYKGPLNVHELNGQEQQQQPEQSKGVTHELEKNKGPERGRKLRNIGQGKGRNNKYQKGQRVQYIKCTHQMAHKFG